MPKLHRHIDVDLVHRIQNGWKPKDEVKPLKRNKTPRLASTYRGARRNALKGR